MAKAKKVAVTPVIENTFEFEGKKYQVLKDARVPLANGAEKLSAADICVHPEAQEYLVKNACSCIVEVTE